MLNSISIEHDDTNAPMTLRTATRLLLLTMECRKRLGLPVADIELELASTRLRAEAMLADCFLRAGQHPSDPKADELS